MMRSGKAGCLLLMSLLIWGAVAHTDDTILFREDFETLDAWEPLSFRNIDRQTIYETAKRDGANALVAKSDGSASALICKRTFNISEYPIVRWRWKIDNVYAKGNYRRKSGDDYPIRVYLLFEFDPAAASAGMKITYGLARALYGRYPPHSVLNYIWANRAEERAAVKSPFTDRSIMIPLEHGPRNVGRWVDESVNAMADYKRFFGDDPPPRAVLAVMNDSDNTGERSTSFIQFIEVRKHAHPTAEADHRHFESNDPVH